MSVAFRRDGDEEHLEPKFEIPIPPGPNLVTERGLAQIGERVAMLEVIIAAGGEETAIASAKRDLRYWQARQITAQRPPAPNGNTVEFGTNVTFLLNGRRQTLSIVGDDEAAPADGLISFSAPLSRALMGGEAGDVLPFAGRDDAIEILAITPTDR